jgi:hypothetical protein
MPINPMCRDCSSATASASPSAVDQFGKNLGRMLEACVHFQKK